LLSEIEITEVEKEKLKRQLERKTFAKMAPEWREILTYHRTQLGEYNE
jgi:hypothetical protein